jgi:prevent-host-death family protein
MSLMASIRSIGADEARTHFYRVPREVTTGETFTVTKRGIPVATIVPVPGEASDAQDLLAEMRSLRRQNRLDGVSMRDLLEDGR